MVFKFKDFVKHPKTRERSKQEGPIAVLAYHAGTENGTGEIAEGVKGASQYVAHNPGKRVASTRVTPTHSKHLTGIREYAKTAISIHGHDAKGNYSKQGREIDKTKTIYVTGGNKDLADKVASQLESNLGDSYHVETDLNHTPKQLQGKSKYNIVNRFENKGVQVELPAELRKNKEHRQIVADSVNGVVKKESSNYQSSQEEYKEAA
jgi:phage replication-related protein YjqB (UPF0714/DUF867 family)